MPIWFELMAMLLVTYVIGLGIGWMVWGRAPTSDMQGGTPVEDDTPSFDEDGDTL